MQSYVRPHLDRPGFPFVAFTYSPELWAFIERIWRNPKFSEYGTWDIVANSLYDFSAE